MYASLMKKIIICYTWKLVIYSRNTPYMRRMARIKYKQLNRLFLHTFCNVYKQCDNLCNSLHLYTTYIVYTVSVSKSIRTSYVNSKPVISHSVILHPVISHPANTHPVIFFLNIFM